ncbi:hypothetical protein BDN70DRAFT_881405 [Pholiota conissans]|uniref:Uncharacterized protein n=1 Tax=Pholiota conissans TaxID=109636 RepID=A0A9P6CYF8_9AGAR|nr:hypothetical protein BDN70DRAFT_881405 [Pholiota conissans]
MVARSPMLLSRDRRWLEFFLVRQRRGGRWTSPTLTGHSTSTYQPSLRLNSPFMSAVNTHTPAQT